MNTDYEIIMDRYQTSQREERDGSCHCSTDQQETPTLSSGLVNFATLKACMNVLRHWVSFMEVMLRQLVCRKKSSFSCTDPQNAPPTAVIPDNRSPVLILASSSMHR